MDLSYLARQLAINHYNVSIAEGNPQIDNCSPVGLVKIFDKTPELDECKFSRNILIIGAGASKDSYGFIEVGSKVISQIQKNLGLNELLKSENFSKKYFQLASYYSNKIYDSEKDFDAVTKNLYFEGNLSMLLHFFRKEDVAKELKDAVGFKFLPSLFYETIAHLFKHRYIDVIINLNFDELLDNAIEDEMGDSTYHKITDDVDCEQWDDIVGESRLRIPIYIKPHGSIRSLSSMRFTNEHYIDLSTNIKEFLHKIFNGNVYKAEGIVKKFNVILAGYSLNDIDIKKVLFKQLSNENFETEYFIFDIANSETYLNRFKAEFNKWTADYSIKTQPDIAEKIERALKLSNFQECASMSDKKVSETTEGLDFHFNLLYRKIKDQFKEPFKPRNTTRHQLLTKLFPRTGITKRIKEITQNPEEFYRYRAQFHCLYDFIKYKGKVPINLLTSDRAGKYQMLCLAEMDRKTIKARETDQNLIGFLKEVVLKNRYEIKIGNSYVTCPEFYASQPGSEIFESVILLIVNHLMNQYLETATNVQQEMRTDIRTILIDEVCDKRTNEINAVYNDSKHGRFYPFGRENIINTNLELTWRFHEFATNPKYDWNALFLIDDAGKSVYNLSLYPKNEDSYLKEISSRRRIFLIHSIKKPMHNLKGKPAINIIKTIKSIYRNNKFVEGFKEYPKEDENNMHRMALFAKKIGKNIVPVSGIYFFRPSTKVKINPVYFIASESVNMKANLKMMKDLFDEAALGTNFSKDLRSYLKPAPR